MKIQWQDRLTKPQNPDGSPNKKYSPKKLLRYLEDFKNAGKEYRDRAGTISAMRDVQAVLDSRWDDVVMTPQIKLGIAKSARLHSNPLSKFANAAKTSWVEAGMQIQVSPRLRDMSKKRFARMAKSSIEYLFDEQNMDELQNLISNYIVVSGMAPVLVRWNKSGGRIVERAGDESQMLPGATDPRKAVDTKREGTIYGEVVDPNQLIIDPAAETMVQGTSLRYPRAFMVLRAKPLQWAREGLGDIKVTRNKEAYDLEPDSGYDREDMFVLGEYFEGTSMEFPRGRYVRFANDEVIIEDTDLAAYYPFLERYPIGTLPLIMYYGRIPANPKKHGVWTRSIFYDLAEHALTYQAIKSLGYESLKKNLNPPITFDPMYAGNLGKSETWVDFLGKFIKAPANSVSPVQLDLGGFQIAAAMMEQTINEMSDTSNYQAADFGESVKNVRSDSQYQTLLQQSQKGRDMSLDRYNKEQDVKMVGYFLEMINDHYSKDPERLREMIGDTEDIILETYPWPQIFDPRNLIIERDSRTPHVAARKRAMMMELLHQGAAPPQYVPYILSDFGVPYGDEAIEDVLLARDFAAWVAEGLLQGKVAFLEAEPIDYTHLNIINKELAKIKYTKMNESNKYPQEYWEMFNIVLERFQLHETLMSLAPKRDAIHMELAKKVKYEPVNPPPEVLYFGQDNERREQLQDQIDKKREESKRLGEQVSANKTNESS